MLRSGEGSVSGAPDDRASGRAPAGVPDVRGAERPAELAARRASGTRIGLPSATATRTAR